MTSPPWSAEFDRIVIVGAGGFGREVANYAQDAGLVVEGFLDDHATGLVWRHPGPRRHRGRRNVALGWLRDRGGDAVSREQLADRVAAGGGRLATVVHPTAYVARDAVLGDGAVLCPFALVGTNATIGNNVAINTYASVGHDANIGAHCVFSPYSVVNGQSYWRTLSSCTHATVVPGRRVGRRTKVAAGGVVTRDVGAGFLLAATRRAAGKCSPAVRRLTAVGMTKPAADGRWPDERSGTDLRHALEVAMRAVVGVPPSFRVGVDVEEIDRWLAMPQPMEKLFTAGEITYCRAQGVPAQHFAGTWCAKEAAVKALSAFGDVQLRDVEIGRSPDGRPSATVRGLAIGNR